MAWSNDFRSVKARFEQQYVLPFEGRDYIFSQDVNSITTVYDAVTCIQSVVLGTYLVQRYRESANRLSFLELGAGSGLPSILLSPLPALRVVSTDLESVLPALSSSISQNCPSASNIQVVAYAWCQPSRGEAVTDLAPPFDVVFAADVIYDFDFFPQLGKSLEMLSNRETEVFVSFRQRYRDAEQWFFDEVRYRFEWTEIMERYPGFEMAGVKIFKLKRT